MLAITFFTFITGIINSFYSSHVAAAYAYELSKKLFDNIQKFTFDLLNRYPTSALVTRFTNDVRQVQNTIFMALRIMMKAPLMVVGGVFMAFIVNPKIASIVLLIVSFLSSFFFLFLFICCN